MSQATTRTGARSGARQGTKTSRSGGKEQSGKRRAVVKANYARTTKAGTRKVKQSAGYYLRRENELGEAQEREAFSAEEDHLTRAEVYKRVELAAEEGEYYYRLIFAPDTDQHAEDVDMRAYAREMMNDLEVKSQQRVAWLAVEHVGDDAHSGHGHVHIIAVTERRLNREDLQEMQLQASNTFDSALDNRLEAIAELEMSGGGKKQLEQKLEFNFSEDCDNGLGL